GAAVDDGLDAAADEEGLGGLAADAEDGPQHGHDAAAELGAAEPGEEVAGRAQVGAAGIGQREAYERHDAPSVRVRTSWLLRGRGGRGRPGHRAGREGRRPAEGARNRPQAEAAGGCRAGWCPGARQRVNGAAWGESSGSAWSMSLPRGAGAPQAIIGPDPRRGRPPRTRRPGRTR